MKIFSPASEIKAIRTICESDPKLSSKVLSQLGDDFFYYDPTKEAHHRIRVLLKASGELPSFSDICNDPTISEDHRKILSKTKEVAVTTEKATGTLINTLQKYNKLRKLYFMSERIQTSLDKDKVDLDDILEDTSNTVSSIRIRSDITQSIYHIGRANNSSTLLKTLLNKEKPSLVPTGYKAFDSKNGGIHYGSLFVIGGTTGGGKSLLAVDLLVKMARHESVCFPPNTLVVTDRGTLPIQDVIVGDYVPSYNLKTGELELKQVEALSETPRASRRLVRVTHEGGSFICTEDHKVWCEIEQDYIEARLLTDRNQVRGL